MFFGIFGALLFLSWAMPLHFLPWISWHNEVLSFAAAACLTAGLIRTLRRGGTGQPVKVPMLVLPFLILAGIAMVQALTGAISFGGDALVVVLYLAMSMCMIVVGYEVGASQVLVYPARKLLAGPIIQFAGLLVIGGLFSSIIAWVQVLDVWDNSSWVLRMPVLRRPGANIGQPNQLATLIMFAIASLIYVFETRRFSPTITVLLMGILLSGLVVTESRTGAISIFSLAIWWMLKERQLSFRLSTTSVAVGLLLYGLSLWFWPMLLAMIQSGHLDSVDPSMLLNLDAGTRLIVWPQLWHAVMQRPWFGWGVREVSQAHNAVLGLYPVSEPFTYAHNIFLDCALGVGLPLTALFFVVIAVWIWNRLRKTTDILSWYCLAVALPFGVHSLFEFPFAYAYLLIPVMLLLGVLESKLAAGREIRLAWRTSALTWLVVSCAMAWSVLEYIKIEEDFRIARFEAAHIGQTPTDYERPQIFLLTQLEALLEGARTVPMPGMSKKKIQLMRSVAMRFPWPATQNRYALTLALNGDPTEATRQLLVLRAMHGNKHYANIRASWVALADEKYPQLLTVILP